MRLKLVLEANGIPLTVLEDPTFKMLLDEREGVDAMRFLQRRYNVTFSQMDQLSVINAVEQWKGSSNG